MLQHTVSQGDCMYSIGERYGFYWKTLWDHPRNASVNELRKDPNVLFAGDVVFIPDIENKEESCATDATHKFRRKAVPAMLRLQLRDRKNQPRPKLPYRIDIDGDLRTGTTDGDGYIIQPIQPTAQQAILYIEEDGEPEKYTLALGTVDPITETTGVQQRLSNLGYGCGTADGTVNSQTENALRAFQKKEGLTETGEPDDSTRARLKQAHGC